MRPNPHPERRIASTSHRPERGPACYAPGAAAPRSAPAAVMPHAAPRSTASRKAERALPERTGPLSAQRQWRASRCTARLNKERWSCVRVFCGHATKLLFFFFFFLVEFGFFCLGTILPLAFDLDEMDLAWEQESSFRKWHREKKYIFLKNTISCFRVSKLDCFKCLAREINVFLCDT